MNSILTSFQPDFDEAEVRRQIADARKAATTDDNREEEGGKACRSKKKKSKVGRRVSKGVYWEVDDDAQ